ncbi:hypothetical protein N9Z67_01005 [Rhodopirellula sp.]|nr:hypothetical protein [Rhodopirellula sp.]
MAPHSRAVGVIDRGRASPSLNTAADDAFLNGTTCRSVGNNGCGLHRRCGLAATLLAIETRATSAASGMLGSAF